MITHDTDDPKVVNSVLRRDLHRCRFCNSSDEVLVHCRSQEDNPKPVPDNYTTMCLRCHGVLHIALGIRGT